MQHYDTVFLKSQTSKLKSSKNLYYRQKIGASSRLSKRLLSSSATLISYYSICSLTLGQNSIFDPITQFTSKCKFMSFAPYFEVKIWIFCTKIQINFLWAKLAFCPSVKSWIKRRKTFRVWPWKKMMIIK